MANLEKKEFHYGGQAVIEGVMMRGPKDYGIAVRKADGEIVSRKEDVESILGRFKWLNKPFLRGTLALIDSMTLGIKALMFSADIAMKDAVEADAAANVDKPGKQSKEVARAEAELEAIEKKGGSINDIALSAMMFVGLAMGVGLFFFVPIVLTKLLNSHIHVGWQLTAVEGFIKIVIFVGYVMAISLMKDIRRVFQYHGAEHKTINAYEAGVELTVDNVKRYSKVHVRCGTSFILVVLVTSIIVFMIIADHLPHGSLAEHSKISYLVRWLYKIALLPFVAGIAYEVIRFAGKFKDSFMTKLLTFPGLLMQKITTREPEPEMIEVAIRSLESVFEKETEREEKETEVVRETS
ncbi:MAG: DUF1385 domain-containing protein [Armatimonadota bacterium]|nr:DUF1385 domain-containing protein [bacterium]